ncbi:uncharacterized protein LOC133496824 [Syngnathoides biaculeatus]|uniref:uncharacterized protein LOC133496824 n=1 Tax=Syngnathoides biaculeatus TaxID=300417 RepID=UPI002ADE15E8|nr:uncharacterized protein LOC133496824 [Syngnathoides biaculeatus]
MAWTKSPTCSLKMITQELIFIFLLKFEGIRGQFAYVFARAGDVAVLPCKLPSCYGSFWLYSPDRRPLVSEVEHGRVLSSSPRSQRLSLKDDCSLRINLVEAGDAGFFTCGQNGQPGLTVFLTVMTLTSFPPDSDPKGAGPVVLKCSLACYPSSKCTCKPRRLRWMDDEGQERSPARTQQNNCVSFIKVLPGGRTRNYTCQYVEKDGVKVQAHYTAVFKGVSTGGPAGPPAGRTRLINIIRVAVAVSLAIVFVSAVVFAKMKSKRNAAQATTHS